MDLGVRGQAHAIVGGSSGIGWETAKLLAAEGADVAVISRRPERNADAMAALAKVHGIQAVAYVADVAVRGSVEAALGRVIEHFGRLHGLAVTSHFMGEDGRFAAMTDDDWDLYYQNSLMGAVRACRGVLPHMAAAGGGSIVLTSAYSSRAPKPFIAAYAAFKAALNNLAKTLAKTHGREGVRVNVVAPGAIKTGRYEARMAALAAEQPVLDPGAAEARLLQRIDMDVALGRIGEPSEVAELITFLLSARAAYATGLIANIDGGTDF